MASGAIGLHSVESTAETPGAATAAETAATPAREPSASERTGFVATPEPGATTDAPAVLLVVHGDPLPTQSLRAALERELGSPIVGNTANGPALRGTLTIRYEARTRELAVSWDGPDEHTLTRAVIARDDPEDAVEDAVLLAGNLARNDAADLIGAEPAGDGHEPVISTKVMPAPADDDAEPPPALDDAEPPPHLLASASLFFPLATDAGRRHGRSSFDFNLVYGRIGSIDGVQLGLINVVTPDRRRGTGSVTGMEVGALANFVSGEVRGLQIAGGLNIAGGGLDGAAIAFLGNSAGGRVRGAQAGLVNRAGAGFEGAQLGLLNLAGNLDGLQIGLVNIGRRVRGVTIGLVNVAEDIDGVPVAPISVTKSGGVHPVVWSGSSGYANAGVKFATRRTYTLFFGAYHRAFERDFAGGGLALGARIELDAGVHMDLDAAGSYLVAPERSTDTEVASTYHEQLVQPRVRLSLGYRMTKHFGVFLGGAAIGQVRSERGWDRVTAAIGPELFGGVEL